MKNGRGGLRGGIGESIVVCGTDGHAPFTVADRVLAVSGNVTAFLVLVSTYLSIWQDPRDSVLSP